MCVGRESVVLMVVIYDVLDLALGVSSQESIPVMVRYAFGLRNRAKIIETRIDIVVKALFV